MTVVTLASGSERASAMRRESCDEEGAFDPKKHLLPVGEVEKHRQDVLCACEPKPLKDHPSFWIHNEMGEQFKWPTTQ
jgi:hypothetical protein